MISDAHSTTVAGAATACPWCGAAMTACGTCRACLEEMHESSVPGLPPLAEVGGCELLEKIGRGGMGVVFKARQRSLDRIVAVKMLAGGPLASETFVARFKAEAEAVAGLQHPGIVAVHEVGEDESGTPWFSMDYIAGPSLAERLKAGPLEPREAARLTKLTAEAMHYAHSRGLLHRDLKPSNILLDEFEHPRVTDFGIARRMDDESTLTITGDILGSPAYMPPEQAAGRSAEVTAASDVYSLGAVLYEMLSGRAPFAAPSRAPVLELVRTAEPLPPRRLNPAIPAELETVCLKCLEKEPARRYATAAELAEEMSRFLRGDPVLARPVSAAGHIWRWARRHKAAALAVASLFVGLTSVAAVLAAMNLRVSKARGEAERNFHDSERHAAESRANLARTYQVTASRYLEEGDHQRALLWLLQAWETTDDPAERRLTGMSLAAALRAAPRLVKVWAPGGTGDCAVFDPKAQRVACANGTPEVRIWSTDPANDTTLTLSHPGGAFGCAFNGDGSRIFTQGANDVRLWDTATGRELGASRAQMENGEFLVQRRPAMFSADGRRLLTFTADGAQLWNAETGGPAGRYLPGPLPLMRGLQSLTKRIRPQARLPGAQPLLTAAVLPDGARCLLACGHQLRLTDAATGAILTSWPTAESPHVLALNGTADRVSVLEGSGTVEVFSLADPAAPAVKFTAPGNNYQATFSPDGKSILTASFAGDAFLFDSATGARVTELHHKGGVARAVWQETRPNVATASWDNTVRLWRMTTMQQVSILYHGGRSLSVDYARDTPRVLTASADGSVRIYDRTGDLVPARMHARLRLSRTRPATAALAWMNDRVVALCHPATGERFGPELQHERKVMTGTVAAGVQHVATLTDDGTVHLWDASQPGAVSIAMLPPGRPASNSLSISSDGTRLLVMRDDGSAALYDGAGKLLRNPVRSAGELRAWNISQDDRLFAALGTDGKTQAWNMSDGSPAGPAFGPERGAWAMHIAPAGDVVCLSDGPPNTTDVKRAVRLWNPVTGEPVSPPLEHYDDIGAIAFSPDGRLLATGSEDYQVIIWDRRTGQPASSSWQHSFWPKLLAFSPDSRILAVAGQDSNFAFLRTSDGSLIGPKRRWLSPPQIITFNETGDALLAVRADNGQDLRSPCTVYEMSLAGAQAEMRDAVTLTSGMTLENDGIVRLLTAVELEALWRRMQK